MLDLKAVSVCVTGGNGFLGRRVVRGLKDAGCTRVIVPTSVRYDLRDQFDAKELFQEHRPDVVIHLAALCGGIGINAAAPADFITDNLAMGVNVISLAAEFLVRKIVLVGTVCSYPANTPAPFRECDFWNGYPEPTNAPYGIAKRAIGEMLAAYHRQHKIEAAYIVPANLYGPGDNFAESSSHVIPAMIRRFCAAAESGASSVTCWGTGNATRDFLHVADAADAIVTATAMLDRPEPLNIGTGREIAMRRLANMVATACGYKGKIVWDPEKPDGQARRVLDISEAGRLLNWRPTIALEDGIQSAVRYWRQLGVAAGELTG